MKIDSSTHTFIEVHNHGHETFDEANAEGKAGPANGTSPVDAPFPKKSNPYAMVGPHAGIL